MMLESANTRRPPFDREMVDIVDYVMKEAVDTPAAYRTAHYCLLDTLGCGLEALSYPACKKLMGPVVPGAEVLNGSRVPGTRFQLDPVQAAFNIGAMIRWLDFNDTGWRRVGPPVGQPGRDRRWPTGSRARRWRWARRR